MRRRLHGSLLFLLTLLSVLVSALPGRGRPAGPSLNDRQQWLAQLREGQSTEDVQRQTPDGCVPRKAHQLVYRQYREQWVYGEPLDVRLDFKWEGGQGGRARLLPSPVQGAPPYQSLRADGR
jgi:hypothetical protein